MNIIKVRQHLGSRGTPSSVASARCPLARSAARLQMVLDDDVVLGQVLDVRRGRVGAGVTAAMTTRPTDRPTDRRTDAVGVLNDYALYKSTHAFTHSRSRMDGQTDGRTDVEVTTVALKTTSRVLDGVHVGAT